VTVIVGLAVTGYGFMQYTGLDPYRWSIAFGGQRPFATLGNPNFLAGHFAVLAPWALGMFLAAGGGRWKDQRSAGEASRAGPAGGRFAKAGWLAVTLAWLLLILVAQTRGAWIACGAAVAWLVWRWWLVDRESIAAQRGWLAALGALVVLAGASAAVANRDLAYRIGDTVPHDMGQLTHRFVAMRAALLIARDHPLAGIGPGCFKHGFGMKMAGAMAAGEYRQFTHTYSEEWTHCEPLQILAETGVPALGIFIWLLAAAVRALLAAGEGRRRLAAGILAAGVAFLFQGSTNYPLHIAPTAFLFWMGIGLAASVAPGRSDEAPAGRWMAPARSAAVPAALAVGMLAGMIFLASLYTRLGKDAMVRFKNWTVARWALDKAQLADWDDRREPFYAGAAYFSLGKYDAAVELFRLDVARNPYYMDAYSNLGSTLGTMGKVSEAVGLFNRAIELNPAYAEAHAGLGVAYLDSGRRARARAAFQRALELDPDLALARNGLIKAGGKPPSPGEARR
jgi:hypothetical protein